MLTVQHRSRVAQLLVAGTAVATITITSAGARGVQPAADAHLAYEDAFLDVAFRIGGVIEIGVGDARSMKGAVGAIDRGELGGDQLRNEATIWTDTIATIGEELRDVPVPRNLTSVQETFLTAVDGYGELAHTLGSIADVADPAQVEALLDRAVALGQEADSEFDVAAATLQRHRQIVGLGTNPNLPDPNADLPPGVTIVEPGETSTEDP